MVSAGCCKRYVRVSDTLHDGVVVSRNMPTALIVRVLAILGEVLGRFTFLIHLCSVDDDQPNRNRPLVADVLSLNVWPVFSLVRHAILRVGTSWLLVGGSLAIPSEV